MGHISSVHVRKSFGMTEAPEDVLTVRRLRWLRHVARMKDDRTPNCKRLLFGWLPQHRPAYGTKLRWRDRVRKDLNKFKIDEVGCFQCKLQERPLESTGQGRAACLHRGESGEGLCQEKWQLFQHIKDNLWLQPTSLCVTCVIVHLGGGRISLGTSIRLGAEEQPNYPVQYHPYRDGFQAQDGA